MSEFSSQKRDRIRIRHRSGGGRDSPWTAMSSPNSRKLVVHSMGKFLESRPLSKLSYRCFERAVEDIRNTAVLSDRFFFGVRFCWQSAEGIGFSLCNRDLPHPLTSSSPSAAFNCIASLECNFIYHHRILIDLSIDNYLLAVGQFFHSISRVTSRILHFIETK